MKLIREYTESISPNIITESSVDGTSKDKKYIISGIFMQANKGNRNGRVYPKAIMEREVERYVKNFVSCRRAVGELSHPESTQINPERVSHLVTELTINGDDVTGTADVLDTPFGKIIRSFIDNNIKFGVSSRGVGSLVKRGDIQEVQNDFCLCAIDVVLDPSAPEAFVSGLTEGYNMMWNSKLWEPRELDAAMEVTKQYKKTKPSKIYEQKAIKVFSDFLKRL